MGRLLEAAGEAKPNHGGARAKIDQWLDTLSDEDRADAESVLRDRKRWGHAVVSRLIRDVHDERFDPGLVLLWRQRRGI